MNNEGEEPSPSSGGTSDSVTPRSDEAKRSADSDKKEETSTTTTDSGTKQDLDEAPTPGELTNREVPEKQRDMLDVDKTAPSALDEQAEQKQDTPTPPIMEGPNQVITEEVTNKPDLVVDTAEKKDEADVDRGVQTALLPFPEDDKEDAARDTVTARASTPSTKTCKEIAVKKSPDKSTSRSVTSLASSIDKLVDKSKARKVEVTGKKKSAEKAADKSSLKSPDKAAEKKSSESGSAKLSPKSKMEKVETKSKMEKVETKSKMEKVAPKAAETAADKKPPVKTASVMEKPVGKSEMKEVEPLSARTPVESKRKKRLKRLFFRIKESVGLVEKTEISKEFTQSLVRLDQYKTCLDKLSDTIYCVIQQNPFYRKENFKVELSPPKGMEEHELVAKCLGSHKGFEEYKNKKKMIELFEKIGSEHREYIKKARASLGHIRSFIQQDYWAIGVQRTELEALRREMDFAKSELKSTKDESMLTIKNQLYNIAVIAFQEKLKQVNSMLEELPKTKVKHFADIEEWMNCTMKFHERMAQLNDVSGT
ncbi:unnamed protein product [Nippostrongylus brasiliensis]|uniref:BAR domain-containing protein n=1 Tax=Nippostrongylus brasiliensis TaxID=27835 RepID=A0A0N4YP94_NIPBR|nr:unnamed protein product [Nippostrongylus brasiliensis]